jgi:hypothetical protein
MTEKKPPPAPKKTEPPRPRPDALKKVQSNRGEGEKGGKR